MFDTELLYFAVMLPHSPAYWCCQFAARKHQCSYYIPRPWVWHVFSNKCSFITQYEYVDLVMFVWKILIRS